MLRQIRSATLSLGLLTLALSLILLGTRAYAQPAPTSGQALEIAPPVVNLKADPGTTVKTDITIRGISDVKLLVSAEVDDFTANGEDGSPKIITDQSEPNPYSMKSWVNPLTPMTLSPHQLVKLPVSITVPKDAAPGGYFSVIRFTGRPPELDGTGVSLSASLGSLILLKVNGDAKENMSIEEFSVRQNSINGPLFESTPLQFTERIKNNGNLHEQPTGLVTITDMFGKKVTNLSINADQRNVLPQSIRKFEETLDSQAIGNRILFGRYTADMTLTYGTNKTTITKQLVFWVIPYRIVGLVVLGLIAAFFLFRFLIRRYNRAIITKAQGGNVSSSQASKPTKKK